MSPEKEQEIVDKINNVNEKINNVNDKLENARIKKGNKNIEQWEAVGKKIPFLKGLANFMVNVNKKQLNKN